MSGYRFDRLRTLVVDDNDHMRKMLSTILRAFGVTTIQEASDGQVAWQRLRSFNPDILFLDWMMPGMTGLEFAKNVRNSPECPNPFVPIIMLTGYTHLDHVRQARDVGINEFLAKPISAKGILTRLTSVIENPRSFVRTSVYFGPCRRRRTNEEYSGPERRSDTSTDPAVNEDNNANARGAA